MSNFSSLIEVLLAFNFAYALKESFFEKLWEVRPFSGDIQSNLSNYKAEIDNKISYYESSSDSDSIKAIVLEMKSNREKIISFASQLDGLKLEVMQNLYTSNNALYAGLFNFYILFCIGFGVDNQTTQTCSYSFIFLLCNILFFLGYWVMYFIKTDLFTVTFSVFILMILSFFICEISRRASCELDIVSDSVIFYINSFIILIISTWHFLHPYFKLTYKSFSFRERHGKIIEDIITDVERLDDEFKQEVQIQF